MDFTIRSYLLERTTKEEPNVCSYSSNTKACSNISTKYRRNAFVASQGDSSIPMVSTALPTQIPSSMDNPSTASSTLKAKAPGPRPSLSAVVYENWVVKEGGSRKTWKKRFFRIKGNGYIFYYKKSNSESKQISGFNMSWKCTIGWEYICKKISFCCWYSNSRKTLQISFWIRNYKKSMAPSSSTCGVLG